MSRRSTRIYGGPTQDDVDHIAKVTEDGKLHVTAADTPLEIKLGDSPSIDAFDRLRISNPVGLFESTQTYDKQPLLWNEELTGGGTATFLPNASTTEMSVSSSGDKVIRQSKVYTRYQPGKSQLIFMTYNFGEGDANVRKRVGYFDADNGVFFEEINGNLWAVLRSNTTGTPVDTRVAQADFNVDTLSNLNINKSQILVIDMEWLGVGRVRVGCVEDGVIRYAHQFLNSNRYAGVYMSTAQLPARYEIEATGAPSAKNSLFMICASIISEGGQEENVGFPFTANGTSLVAITTARQPLISVRPKLTYNGLVNRVEVIQRQIQSIVSGTGVVALFELVFDGALTGASWNSVDAQSVVEYDTSATVVTGGHCVRSFYATSTNQSKGTEEKFVLGRLPLALDIAGTTGTILTLAVTELTGAATATGAFNWQEYR